MLGVADPPASALWWNRLGFETVETDAEHQGGAFLWAYLRRGEAAVMLTKGDEGAAPSAPVQLYFQTDDVDALWAEITREFGDDLTVDEAPRDTHYGMRDFWIRTPEGFQLGFGERSKLR